MRSDITAWLHGVGLGKFADAFVENDVDLSLVSSLTRDDLHDLGITKIGDRRRFANAVAALDTTDAPAAPGTRTDIADTLPAAGRRQVTVLFADICGFTDLSHCLDPETIHSLLNEFFSVADQIIAQHGGVVDKHIGDAVMAVFGAPVAHTDDPLRAVRAACALHRAVGDLARPVGIHAGVASGRVVASATGSSQHTQYTVTGDSVNLAARLTDLAGAGQTLISATVRRALGRWFEGDELGERLIAGLPEPVEIWRVDRLAEAIDDPHPFVGRDAELDQFGAILRASQSGRNGAVLILRGEPGIGKTRLMGKFAAMAQAGGASVHRGLVLDFGTGKGQDAVRAIARSLLGIPLGSDKRTRGDAVEAALSSALLQEKHRAFINDLLDLSQPAAVRGIYDAMDNAARNKGKCDALAALCIRLADRQPLVLCIEDLHWADQIVLSHAATLARITATHPIIVVLSTRLSGDPFDRNWLTVCGDAQVMAISLDPLGEREAIQLARHFESIEATRLQACVDRAAGNPLLLEQLLLNADEAAGPDLPGSVQTIVQARVDALPPQERETLQAASILGQRFTGDQVVALMEGRPFKPDELLAHGLIKGAAPWFQFSHALIRDGVYETLLTPRRIGLHRKAADAFRDIDPELYARHLDAAEDPAAPGAYLAAARLEHGKLRFESALHLTVRGLELPGDTATRFDLLCFQGEILRDLGRPAESLDPYGQAREIAPDDGALCQAELGMAASLRIVDRIDDALASLARTEQIATRGDLELVLAEVRFLRGNLFFPLGRIAECRGEHAASLDHAKRAGSREAEARALGGLGDAAYVGGSMASAARYFTECVSLARSLDLRRIELANLPMKGWCEMFLLEFDAAQLSGEQAVTEAAQFGVARAEIIARNLLCEIAFVRKDTAALAEHSERALFLAKAIGARRFEAVGLIHTGRHRWMGSGDPVGAYATLQEACDIARETGVSFMGPWALGTAARVATTEADRWAALREGEEILTAEAVHHNYLLFYKDAIEACAQAGEWDHVQRYAEALSKTAGDEPVPWTEFFSRRGAALARAATVDPDDQLVGEVEDLLQIASTRRLSGAITHLEYALRSLRQPSLRHPGA